MSKLQQLLDHLATLGEEDIDKLHDWCIKELGLTPTAALSTDPDNDGDNDTDHPSETGER